MVLTVDNGQSLTKVVSIETEEVKVQASEAVEGAQIQEKLIRWCNESATEKLAIATTWFIDKNAQQAYFKVDGQRVTYIDLPQLREASAVQRAALYNDAEAAAIALNVPCSELVIQAGREDPEGNQGKVRKKTLVYLGTGFQLVRTHYDTGKEIYVAEYGGGLRSSPPLSLLSRVEPALLERIVQQAGVDNIGKLRHSHFLGARGLTNIHAAVTGIKTEPSEIIAHPEEARNTFEIYSRILGLCLHNFVSTDGFSQSLYLGGSFAPVLAPYLQREVIAEAFSLPGDFTAEAYKSIHLAAITDPLATHRGLAFACAKKVSTTSNVY